MDLQEDCAALERAWLVAASRISKVAGEEGEMQLFLRFESNGDTSNS